MFSFITGVKDLCEKLITVPGADLLSVKANFNATILMKCLVRATFCARRVTEEFRLSTEAFEWLLGEIETRFQQAHVSIRWSSHQLSSGKRHDIMSLLNHHL